MSHKCILPWISVETTPGGTYRPCCIYRGGFNQSVYEHTPKDILESLAMKKLRQQFVNGEKPSPCVECWGNEDAGRKSKRQYMLEKFKHIDVDMDDPDDTKLKFLDLKLGNICNLKCRICGSWSSSRWAQEETAVFGKDSTHHTNLIEGQWPRKAQQFWDGIDEILPDIEYFEFTGGEPFLIKEHFELLQQAVNSGYAENIDIHYNTNGTIFPVQHYLWKEFKHVQIAFSVDNVEQKFEYERHGALWDTVNDNITKINELRADYPISTQLCVTWNIQNIYYIKELLDWAVQQEFNDVFFNVMHNPWYFSLQYLNLEWYDVFQQQCDRAAEAHPYFEKHIQGLKNFMRVHPPRNHMIIQELKEIDARRNENFSLSHPEVAKLIGYND